MVDMNLVNDPAMLRDEPLEKLWGVGGGRSTKKKFMQGKVAKKNSCKVNCTIGLTNCTCLKTR